MKRHQTGGELVDRVRRGFPPTKAAKIRVGFFVVIFCGLS